MAKDRRRWPRYGRGRAAKVAGGGGAATKEEPSPAEAALAGAPKEFGPSQATVQVSGRAQVDAASQQLFGRQLSNQELASLTGAPAGSNVAVSAHGGRMESQCHPPKHRSCQPVPLPERGGSPRDPQQHLHDQGDADRFRLRDGWPADGAGLEARREVHLDRCRTQRRSPGLHRLPRVAQDGLRRADPRERATGTEAHRICPGISGTPRTSANSTSQRQAPSGGRSMGTGSR